MKAHLDQHKLQSCTFIESSDPRWKCFLKSTPHDFYHLPSYTMLSAKYDGGSPMAFYAETQGNALLVPLLIRPVPNVVSGTEEWTDLASPYGYPGPLFYDPEDTETTALLLRAFLNYAADHNVITAYIRLHPLLNPQPEVFGELGRVVIPQGDTVYVDLSESEEILYSTMRRDHRADIKKVSKLGFTVHFDDWSRLNDFVGVYHSTMQRVSAASFYCFPESYFCDLREALGDRLHLCSVSSPDGEYAGGGIFSLINGISQGHLAGTAEKYLRHGTAKLVTYSEFLWAKSAGSRVFHLGGGVQGRSDSLLYYKTGFSKLTSHFCSWRPIFSEDKYKRLLDATSVACPVGSFFPAYRRPE